MIFFFSFLSSSPSSYIYLYHKEITSITITSFIFISHISRRSLSQYQSLYSQPSAVLQVKAYIYILYRSLPDRLARGNVPAPVFIEEQRYTDTDYEHTKGPLLPRTNSRRENSPPVPSPCIVAHLFHLTLFLSYSQILLHLSINLSSFLILLYIYILSLLLRSFLVCHSLGYQRRGANRTH